MLLVALKEQSKQTESLVKQVNALMAERQERDRAAAQETEQARRREHSRGSNCGL